MKFNLVEIPIRPYSRFHFGKMSMDHDLALADTSYFAHSDTLFSALVNNSSRLEGKGQSIVDYFESDDIRISSLLYFIRNSRGSIYLLPKPPFLNAVVDGTNSRAYKALSKLKFLSKNVWDEGLRINQWFDKSKYRIVQENIVVTKDEYKKMNFHRETKILKIVSSPKSPIHNGPKSSIFYQSDVVINNVEGCSIGLYFLYKCSKKAKLLFSNAVNLTAISGIGGEINIQGRTIPPFNLKDVFEKTIEFNESGSLFSNISLFNPKSQEEMDAVIYHESILRGGRYFEHRANKNHAKVVRMIAEGSLFEHQNIEGRLVPIGTDMHGNTMMRNGKPLLIPIHYE